MTYPGADEGDPHPYQRNVTRRWKTSGGKTVTKTIYSNKKDYKLLCEIVKDRGYKQIRVPDMVKHLATF